MNPSWIRRSAIAVGVLLLVLAIGAAALIATFDANRYKSLAIDWMKTERQRVLVLDGPVELSVFPRLAVKLSKVRLSEHGRSDEFMAVDEAALAVQLLPLLRQQLVIDRVSARGVRATYLRDAQGLRNIDDLFTSDSSAPAADGKTLRLDISAIQFDDLQLSVRDEMANVAGKLTLQSFTSGRLANQVAVPVTLRAQLELTRPQALSLALDGQTTLTPDFDKGAASLASLKLDLQGQAAGVKDLALNLDGALAWDGAALRAGPLKAALNHATLGGTTLTASSLDVKRALFSPQGQKLELEALQLALTGRQGQASFEVALDWPQLAVDAQRLAGSALTGRFKLAGANALTGSLSSAAPSGNFDALRLPGLAVKLAGSAGKRKIDGDVKTDVLLHVGRSAATFERLALRATLTDEALQPLQLSVNGSASADAKAAQWTLTGALNANRFNSDGRASFGAGVSNIKATARFDSLDLNKLLAADKPTPNAAAPADAPVPLDGLKAINGQFAFTAGAFALRQYKVADARVEATLNNGSLRIARLAGRAWGGSIETSGSADASTQRIAIKLAASGVDVNALLKDVAGKDLLEGNGRVVADVHTRGASLGALRSNLAGTAALQLRDGAVKGVNLARSLRKAKAALSLQQDAITQASNTEKTDFSELSATARIANGVAQSDDLDAKSPFLRLGGAGTFDVGRGRIDYTARATVVAAAAGQDSGELAALRGVTVPVLLSGPFEAIDWKIQWSGVAAAAVSNQLKDKLAEKLSARLGIASAASAGAASSAPATPRDQIKDALRGLFK